MNQIACLRCKQMIDSQLDQCPHCGEKVTAFQRTYSSRLLDGKYQIIDRLGVGGMGEIFKVRHIHLNELRVIKIMRPNVAADDQGLQRFLQEARTSTMIKHKNLAMLYDFAQLEDSSYYMVWEFIDGTNIQKWTSEHGAMPPRLAMEIAIQSLQGLDHLHSMGLIHRDVSPENIMLSQDHHGKLMVKVIDFGIAKQLAEGEGGQGLTQTGMFLGKLKYASPEQAGFLSDDEQLDARSDLYSFGIVMYEMLAGKAPFHATNPHSYILKHVTERPIAINAMNPAVVVPPQLESMVMRSLEKQRDARYATAADFAAGLEALRETIPPDSKYGLGEKMITLSGAQTLADLKSSTGAFSGTISPTGMRPLTTSSDASTVIERTGTVDAHTVIENLGASSAPTLMEKLGKGSEPTVQEAKWTPLGDAAPTVAAPRLGVGPETKKSAGPLVGVAVGVLLIVAGVFYFARRQAVVPLPQPVTPSAAQVTSTASTPTVIPAGKGALLLSANPWGDIEKIVKQGDSSALALPEDHSTPARIDLPPGNYDVTLAGPDGKTQTVGVSIELGKPTRTQVEMAGHVDVDAVTNEALPREKNR